MKTRSVLVRFPGYLFGPHELTPERQLAVLASCLVEAGHETTIYDYATTDMSRRLFPEELRGQESEVVEELRGEISGSLFGAARRRRKQADIARQFVERQDKVVAQLAAEIGCRLGLAFAGFHVATGAQLAGTVRFAQLLRSHVPNLPAVAFGPFVDFFADHIAEMTDAFDCLCVGDSEQTLVDFASAASDRRAWPNIPNLVYRDRNRILETERRSQFNLDALPQPIYDPDVYPALEGHGKLRLFSIEDSRGGMSRGHGVPWQVFSRQGTRLRSSRSVCDEMQTIQQRYGGRAFHFAGRGASGVHIDAIAYEILSRGLDVLYSRDASIGSIDVSSFASLKVSGCHAVSFQVDSGSQRLLDRHYGRDFCISEVENTLRSARSADIFTVAEFCYPCPEDDYHTQAETLRVIQRTKPHGIRLEYPEVVPGTAWCKRPASFGYEIDHDGYLEAALMGAGCYPLFGRLDRVMPVRTGRRTVARSVREQHELMAMATEDGGVMTGVSAPLAVAAGVCGHEGREDVYCRRLTEALWCGNRDEATEIVEQFNVNLSRPSGAVVFRPFRPIRIAVGN